MQLILKKNQSFKKIIILCDVEKKHLQALAQAINIKCVDIHCFKNEDVKKKLGTSHITFTFEKKEPKKGNQGSFISFPFINKHYISLQPNFKN